MCVELSLPGRLNKLGKESLPTLTNQGHENLSGAEVKAFNLIVPEHQKSAINIDEFLKLKVPGYTEERIKSAKSRIADKKKRIEEMGTGPSQRAKLLEAIMTNQIELNDWFGGNTHTVIPSEYDDFFHGIDLALEIVDEEKDVKYLAAGIDVTSSSAGLRKKLAETKKRISDGELTMMEYFHSDDYNPDFYGAMMNIPYIVIGTERKTIEELSDLWMSAYGLAEIRKKLGTKLSPEAQENQRKSAKEAINRLANHRVQILLLEQVKAQLIVYKNYADKVKRKEISDKLSSTLSLVDLILTSKRDQKIDDLDKNSNDLVSRSLIETLEDFDNL